MTGSSQPLVIAHRGASATHPANSWAAFRGAVSEGADVIEFDLVMNEDGRPVISHDYAVNGRLIAEMSAQELTKQSGFQTPDFGDVLDWASEEGMHLLIEIKDPNVASVLAGMLRGRDAHRVTVGSFHGPCLRQAKDTNADIRTSLMIGSVLDTDDLVHLAERYHCDGVHPCWENRAPYPNRLLSQEDMETLREHGFQVTLWHEERAEELVRLIDLRPDGICTNKPALLRRLLSEPRSA